MVESLEPQDILGQDKCLFTSNMHDYEAGYVILTSGDEPHFHFDVPSGATIMPLSTLDWQEEDSGTSIVLKAKHRDKLIRFYL